MWQLLFRFGVGRVFIFLALAATVLYFVMVNNTALRESAQIYFNGIILATALVSAAVLMRRFR